MRKVEVIRRALAKVNINGQAITLVKETAETISVPVKGHKSRPAAVSHSFFGANRMVPMGARFPR